MGYLELCEMIFGNRDGYICLAYIENIADRSQSQYHETFYHWSEQIGEMKAWIEEHKDKDCYFCPHLLSEPRRRKELALPGHVIWADLDNCQPEALGKYGEPEPSVLVQTSLNHWQSYWFLATSVEPQQYEELNHRIALGYKEEGCDQSGWDLTQLLRIPGTTNNKKEPFIIEANLMHRYQYLKMQFDGLPQVPQQHHIATVTFSGELPQIDINQVEVSNKLKGLITKGWYGGCGYKSRSELDMAVINALVGKCYSDDEIRAVFTKYAIGEKYREQGEAYLKHQIAAAKEYVERGNMDKKEETEVIDTSLVELRDGTLAEQVRDPSTGKVSFVVYRQGVISYEPEIGFEGKIYKPIDDDMVRQGVVLFPSKAVEYSSLAHLLEDIRTFIHKYLDVRPQYERLASYYTLLSWVYDAYSVLPYLRFLGGWSTGKSRGLDVFSRICYKTMQVSGATTISPMFRIIEKFAGTLIIDEADISKGDEYTEFIKVLNTGYQKGKPLLRTERVKGDVLEPRAYRVYCPKIVATRHKYQDQALESRFLTEQMDREFDKERIPLNLPPEFNDEALALRNQLLYFRLTKLKEIKPEVTYAQRGIEPRVWQVLAPLMQLIEAPGARQELRDYAYSYTQTIREDRGESLNGEVVDILFGLIKQGERLTVKSICEAVNEKYHDVQDRLTPRKVGNILRGLGLVTKRYKDGFCVELEASDEAMELIKRQYEVVVEGGGESKQQDNESQRWGHTPNKQAAKVAERMRKGKV